MPRARRPPVSNPHPPLNTVGFITAGVAPDAARKVVGAGVEDPAAGPAPVAPAPAPEPRLLDIRPPAVAPRPAACRMGAAPAAAPVPAAMRCSSSSPPSMCLPDTRQLKMKLTSGCATRAMSASGTVSGVGWWPQDARSSSAGSPTCSGTSPHQQAVATRRSTPPNGVQNYPGQLDNPGNCVQIRNGKLPYEPVA